MSVGRLLRKPFGKLFLSPRRTCRPIRDPCKRPVILAAQQRLGIEIDLRVAFIVKSDIGRDVR